MKKHLRRGLRTRFMVAMLAIALGVLVMTALITAGLARRTATDAARNDVERSAPDVATALDGIFVDLRGLTPAQIRQRAVGTVAGPRIKALIQTTLRVSGGSVVALDSAGNQREILRRLFGSGSALVKLPHGVTASDLDTKQLLAGKSQHGQDGSTVFAAVPLTPIANLTPVVVIAKDVESRPFGRANGAVLFAALGAILVAALVAAYLARRMTRPIAAMEATAGQISAGDLSARVDVRDLPHDELGDLGAAINAMGEELQAARGHERAFLLSVSHDLRTPLTSIRGYAAAIADGTIDDSDAQLRAAEVIMSEARRLQRLVADLLDLARLDARQFSLNPHRIDASAVVGEIVDAFGPQAADLELRLDYVTDGPVPVDADPERLGQIAANLVENALKYATTAVRIAVAGTADSVSLTVDDDGPGIAAVDLPHVFERLYASRTVPGRSVGTGIGLAIVHELAGAMGGRAAVEPVGNTGTRFVVTLPGVPVPNATSAPAGAPTAAASERKIGA